MRNKGFTLIELLITIAIIGILAGGATTAYIGVTKQAARQEAFSSLNNLALLQEQFLANNGNYAPLNGAYIWYNASPGDASDNGIEDFLPGFKPGGCLNCARPHGLNYRYRLLPGLALNAPTIPYAGFSQVVVQVPCFIVLARGMNGTRAAGDKFVIDCNNTRNF